MRSIWLTVFLSASVAQLSYGQDHTAGGPFVAHQLNGAVTATIVGSYAVDSLDIRVHVDSARLWRPASPEQEEWLGGIAVGIASSEQARWDILQRSPYLLLNQRLAGADTAVLHDLDFAVSRAHITSLPEHWLVFSLALGSLEGRADVPALAFWYAHSPRDLFDRIMVRALRRPPGRPEDADSQLSVISCPSPESVSSHWQGRSVQVSFVVDTSGRVEPASVKVLQQYAGTRGEAAGRYVRSCRFRAARVDGRLVRMKTQTTVQFR
jgi:hypothetical protein